MLLDHGVSLKARDGKGKTVMDYVGLMCQQNTCATPSKEMVAFLEKASGESVKPMPPLPTPAKDSAVKPTHK